MAGLTSSRNRFTWLFLALIIMLASYPYFSHTTTGTALGALTSLLVLGTGVRAVGARPRTRILTGILALAAFAASMLSLLGQVSGSIWTESSFTAFYAVTTAAVFREIVRLRHFNRDAILGAVSVYLLIGVTFGSLFDLIETIEPGSFRLNVELDGAHSMGFRQLLFFSFMTLTSIGYGDITPTTEYAQSLTILEGVAGVLYVAVLVGGVVNAYRHDDAEDRVAEG